MQFIHAILRQRLLERAGLAELPKGNLTLADLEKEIDTKVWCHRFFDLMRNRLLMGRLRYGPMKSKSTHNLVKAMKDKITLYEKTGNDELMVDVGNYAMLQFSRGTHPTKHFSALDDVSHAQKL